MLIMTVQNTGQFTMKKYGANQFDTLLSVSTQSQAEAIQAALATGHIQAMIVSAGSRRLKRRTSSSVAVVVRRADFDRAKNLLEDGSKRPAGIDWSTVSLAAAAETPLVGRRVDLLPPTLPSWWLLELTSIALCFMQWVFTDTLTPKLIYAASGLALAGLFLALWPFATKQQTARSFILS